MRKIIPCLLIAGTVVVAGCNQQGPSTSSKGSGPGVIASDDPLTYVPADTPYVLANIDPLPADITSGWIAKVDKNGKIGDVYAADIDSLEKVVRDQGASCAPAASGGGGSAMQDPPAAQGSSDNPGQGSSASPASDANGDTAPQAAGAPAGEASAPQIADVAAPPEDKCSAADIAQRDKMLKRMDAIKAEVAGKNVQGMMDLLGVEAQTHVAVYGIGLVPVFRIELAKPDNLRATLGRLETAVGSKLKTGKVGSLDYWIVDDDKADSQIEVVFAISGKQLVATFAPVKASDADLRILFGLDKPKQSLADSGGLTALDKKMNYLSYGSGYLDSAKLEAVLKAPATPLETSFLTAAGGQKKPAVDPVCAAEYDQLVTAWPRASFGYSDLSTQHLGVHAVLETRADIAQDLMTLRAPMPGLAASQDALVDFGFSANLAKLPDLATKYAAATEKAPWKCPALASLNQGMEQSKTSLTNPSVAGTAPLFHGFHAIIDKLDLKSDQPMPDVLAVVAIGSDNPAGLLGMAGSMVPGLATMGLKPDGKALPLPAMPNLPVSAPMFAAMTDKVLALSIGAGEDARIAGAMKTDDAQQPLLELGAKGEIYHVIAQYERTAAQKLGDPATQKTMEQQAVMMDSYADWIKHFDARIELTAQGIELNESVDAK